MTQEDIISEGKRRNINRKNRTTQANLDEQNTGKKNKISVMKTSYDSEYPQKYDTSNQI